MSPSGSSQMAQVLHAPSTARGVIVTRIVVSVHALWIILSRPCLTSLLDWPEVFRVGMPRGVALRYGWFLRTGAERALFIALMVLLAAATLSRASSLAAALLLYHFAPLEDAMTGAPGPYMGGLTVDVLALAVLAFVPRVRHARASGDFRWPVVLVRFAVAGQYLFALIAKGLGWFTGRNIADVARTFDLIGAAPQARIVIDHPVVAWTIAIGWLAVSIGMPVAVVSRPVARVIVPLAAIAHIVAVPLFGVVWLAAPLLLLFLPIQDPERPRESMT
jgi:hypothetical protein